MSGEFRKYLFPHDHPRLAEVRGLDPYAYREHARTPGTFTGGLVEGWTPLYRDEFRGVTEDGTLREGLYELTPAEPGEGAPVAAMVAAANEVREKALALMRASLSPEGYELAHAMMLINGFLGEVVDLETVLNEFSYNIALYGEPDLRAPWGWQLFGHHAAVNVLVVEGRMVVSPVFLGAEPDEIDAGPHAGLTGPFADRIDDGLRLMAALPAEPRRGATVYEQMVNPAIPEGRVHPGDAR